MRSNGDRDFFNPQLNDMAKFTTNLICTMYTTHVLYLVECLYAMLGNILLPLYYVNLECEGQQSTIPR